jgi:chromate transporter
MVERLSEDARDQRAWLARRSLAIGLASFGGPAAQIALIHKEFVAEGKKVDEDRFLNALNYCMLLPGPEAQQLATYCGWMVGGVRGGLVAGLLFILPGALAMLALSFLYVGFGSSPLVESLFHGIKAAVLAIVLQALARLGGRALASPLAWTVAGLSFLALFLFKLPFPAVVIAAALAGIAFAPAAPLPAATAPHMLQAERTPARPSALAGLAVGLCLWGLPVGTAMLLLSPQHVLVEVAGFFSTMALVSFGGAYALLSYMAQVAVEARGWLTPGEMLDGLGLAETTPGPLILVTQFVGFLGGYRDPAPLSPALGGLLAAMMTTWVTFAPSFLFILLGAPFVERIRTVAWLSRALTAVTAAVVGTILNLSAWFALNALFSDVGTLEWGPLSMPLPDIASFDPPVLVLAALAALLLFRLKRGVAEIVVVCGLAGLGLHLAGLAG